MFKVTVTTVAQHDHVVYVATDNPDVADANARLMIPTSVPVRDVTVESVEPSSDLFLEVEKGFTDFMDWAEDNIGVDNYQYDTVMQWFDDSLNLCLTID